MTEFSEETAKPIVLELIKRQAHKLNPYPQLDRDDLFQEIMIEARKAWPKYNPRYAVSTFINLVGHRRLSTIIRGLERGRGRDCAVARSEAVGQEVVFPAIDADELIDWLTDTHEKIRRNFATYKVPLVLTGRRGGVFTFDRAQAVAMFALMKRQNLSCRGTVMLFKARPALCRAIGLPRCPSYRYFAYLKDSVQRINFSSGPSAAAQVCE